MVLDTTCSPRTLRISPLLHPALEMPSRLLQPLPPPRPQPSSLLGAGRRGGSLCLYTRTARASGEPKESVCVRERVSVSV